MRLTSRQSDVADLLLEGMGAKEMAEVLGIAHRTVKNYLAQLYEIYGITDGIKKVKLAVELYYERHPEARV